ncbi:MAG: hypothetical protein Q7U02_05485 [Desulfosalsimonadaceae bacterium]|nr:hypothetical protein [Desulfosalsimonadaceae bacterium]
MKQLLIVTSRPDDFADLAAGLSSHEPLSIAWADSTAAAQAAVSGKKVDLAVIDETVGDQPGLTVARDILMKNAMVNLAVVSRLSPEIFHDTAEGLGIMLQLPPRPDAGQVKMLMETMKSITGS